MSKIESIGKKINNGKMMRIEDMLEDVVSDIGVRGALKKGSKALVVTLDDTDGKYNVNYYQAGMKMSECLALCEAVKAIFLQNMNYIPSDD